ncbi:MAG: hypothetical protein WDO14_15120 [Bacteroidota bacterium]
MRKLEDIPKQNPFKVPDGYFDQLPTVIQSRMTKDTRHAPMVRVISLSLKLALPVAALVVAGIFWFRPATTLDDQLEGIDTEQIALYLSNTEHADIDESQDNAGFTIQELDQLQDTIYSKLEYSDEDLLDDIDLENL